MYCSLALGLGLILVVFAEPPNLDTEMTASGQLRVFTDDVNAAELQDLELFGATGFQLNLQAPMVSAVGYTDVLPYWLEFTINAALSISMSPDVQLMVTTRRDDIFAAEAAAHVPVIECAALDDMTNDLAYSCTASLSNTRTHNAMFVTVTYGHVLDTEDPKGYSSSYDVFDLTDPTTFVDEDGKIQVSFNVGKAPFYITAIEHSKTHGAWIGEKKECGGAADGIVANEGVYTMNAPKTDNNVWGKGTLKFYEFINGCNGQTGAFTDSRENAIGNEIAYFGYDADTFHAKAAEHVPRLECVESACTVKLTHTQSADDFIIAIWVVDMYSGETIVNELTHESAGNVELQFTYDFAGLPANLPAALVAYALSNIHGLWMSAPYVGPARGSGAYSNIVPATVANHKHGDEYRLTLPVGMTEKDINHDLMVKTSKAYGQQKPLTPHFHEASTEDLSIFGYDETSYPGKAAEYVPVLTDNGDGTFTFTVSHGYTENDFITSVGVMDQHGDPVIMHSLTESAQATALDLSEVSFLFTPPEGTTHMAGFEHGNNHGLWVGELKAFISLCENEAGGCGEMTCKGAESDPNPNIADGRGGPAEKQVCEGNIAYDQPGWCSEAECNERAMNMVVKETTEMTNKYAPDYYSHFRTMYYRSTGKCVFKTGRRTDVCEDDVGLIRDPLGIKTRDVSLCRNETDVTVLGEYPNYLRAGPGEYLNAPTMDWLATTTDAARVAFLHAEAACKGQSTAIEGFREWVTTPTTPLDASVTFRAKVEYGNDFALFGYGDVSAGDIGTYLTYVETHMPVLSMDEDIRLVKFSLGHVQSDDDFITHAWVVDATTAEIVFFTELGPLTDKINPDDGKVEFYLDPISSDLTTLIGYSHSNKHGLFKSEVHVFNCLATNPYPSHLTVESINNPAYDAAEPYNVDPRIAASLSYEDQIKVIEAMAVCLGQQTLAATMPFSLTAEWNDSGELQGGTGEYDFNVFANISERRLKYNKGSGKSSGRNGHSQFSFTPEKREAWKNLDLTARFAGDAARLGYGDIYGADGYDVFYAMAAEIIPLITPAVVRVAGDGSGGLEFTAATMQGDADFASTDWTTPQGFSFQTKYRQSADEFITHAWVVHTDMFGTSKTVFFTELGPDTDKLDADGFVSFDFTTSGNTNLPSWNGEGTLVGYVHSNKHGLWSNYASPTSLTGPLTSCISLRCSAGNVERYGPFGHRDMLGRIVNSQEIYDFTEATPDYEDLVEGLPADKAYFLHCVCSCKGSFSTPDVGYGKTEDAAAKQTIIDILAANTGEIGRLGDWPNVCYTLDSGDRGFPFITTLTPTSLVPTTSPTTSSPTTPGATLAPSTSPTTPTIGVPTTAPTFFRCDMYNEEKENWTGDWKWGDSMAGENSKWKYDHGTGAKDNSPVKLACLAGKELITYGAIPPRGDKGTYRPCAWYEHTTEGINFGCNVKVKTCDEFIERDCNFNTQVDRKEFFRDYGNNWEFGAEESDIVDPDTDRLMLPDERGSGKKAFAFYKHATAYGQGMTLMAGNQGAHFNAGRYLKLPGHGCIWNARWAPNACSMWVCKDLKTESECESSELSAACNWERGRYIEGQCGYKPNCTNCCDKNPYREDRLAPDCLKTKYHAAEGSLGNQGISAVGYLSDDCPVNVDEEYGTEAPKLTEGYRCNPQGTERPTRSPNYVPTMARFAGAPMSARPSLFLVAAAALALGISAIF